MILWLLAVAPLALASGGATSEPVPHNVADLVERRIAEVEPGFVVDRTEGGNNEWMKTWSRSLSSGGAPGRKDPPDVVVVRVAVLHSRSAAAQRLAESVRQTPVSPSDTHESLGDETFVWLRDSVAIRFRRANAVVFVTTGDREAGFRFARHALDAIDECLASTKSPFLEYKGPVPISSTLSRALRERIGEVEPDWKIERVAAGDVFTGTWVPITGSTHPQQARLEKITVMVTRWADAETARVRLLDTRRSLSVGLEPDAEPIGDESYRYCVPTRCTIHLRSGSLQISVAGPADAAERFARGTASIRAEQITEEP